MWFQNLKKLFFLKSNTKYRRWLKINHISRLFLFTRNILYVQVNDVNTQFVPNRRQSCIYYPETTVGLDIIQILNVGRWTVWTWPTVIKNRNRKINIDIRTWFMYKKYGKTWGIDITYVVIFRGTYGKYFYRYLLVQTDLSYHIFLKLLLLFR